MGKKLEIGDSVCIVDTTRSLPSYKEGKVVGCKLADGVYSYEVYGEDKKTYVGYYGNLENKGICFYAYDEYLNYLKEISDRYKNDISKLTEKKKTIDMEIGDVQYDIRLKEKENEMMQCNHLFVKLKEGVSYSGFHSSDYGNDPSIVKCVHCGLTNYYMDPYEMEFRYLYGKRDLKYMDMNTRVFKIRYHEGYRRGGKSFSESILNCISKEVLKSNHSEKLYQMALKIKPDGSNEEIFEIMKLLYRIETPKERISHGAPPEEELMERYKTLKLTK